MTRPPLMDLLRYLEDHAATRRGTDAAADAARLLLAADLVRQVLCGPLTSIRLAPASPTAEVRVCVDGVVRFLRAACVSRDNVPLYFAPEDRERVLAEHDRQQQEDVAR